MREEKEQVPPEGIMKKPSYDKFLRSDVNMKDKFNGVMLAYATRDPKAAGMLAEMEGENDNLFSIGIGILKNPKSNTMAISAHLIAQAMLMLAFQLEWNGMVRKMIIEAYDRKNGYPVSLASAFIGAINRGKYGNVRNAIGGAFEEERNEEACALLANLGDRKLALDFRKELVRNASEGEGVAKMNALAALSSAIDDAEVKTTFISLLDDWDDDARRFSAGVLAKVKDNEVALKAIGLLENEYDAEMKFRLVHILETNREIAVAALIEKLKNAKEKKDAETIVSLLLKIEKKEKLKGLVDKIRDSVSEEIGEVLDKLFK